MRKLRIIQVVNVRWFNATAWYGLFLSRLLKEAGHEVLVLGLGGTESFAKAEAWGLKPKSLPLNSRRPWKAWGLWRSLRRVVREFKPDLVNCHRGESFALWALVKYMEGGFALVRTRGDQRPPRNDIFNRLLHTRSADILIVSNTATADIFLDYFNANPERVFTITGGVDTGVFYPDAEAGRVARTSLGWGPEDFVVGLLGRLDPVKGHEILIKALGRLKNRLKERFNCKFLCLGMDSEMSEADVKRLCRESGIENNVVVTGRVDDVRAWLNALDLGVLSSVASEAIARAALEILACGKPLLSSDIGVMPDILPSEFLTPLADIQALSEALERCMLDRDFLERLRLAGQEAIKSLRAEDFLENTLAAYAKALAAAGRG
ncbi:MAG: glycosyltransferase [Deltaproteobacteria bacterium]|jgi:glycosyltransferase involved in cell wall biosynthesis|nr:glycosyltransferase [Deltaproteobacteria bacterium]